MRAMQQWLDRFCARHPRLGIPGLMRYIVIGNVLVYLLDMFSKSGYAMGTGLLGFSASAILQGQVWRLVTFIFVPASSHNIFFFLVTLYFYYFIGNALENEWGANKFTIFYLFGVILNIAVGFLVGTASMFYVNMSMFFAFAFLVPDTTVLLFFILPVRMKWLAYLDGALFAFDIIKAIGAHNWAGVVLPIVALLNFAVFIWPEVHYLKERAKYQNSRKTVQFRQAQQQQAKQAQQQGYRHKCAVCGRTDTDYPDLQFRYCSKCVGYHCFCQDHIFNHVHFTEE